MTTKILSEKEIDALLTAVSSSDSNDTIEQKSCCEKTEEECKYNFYPPNFCHYCGKKIEDKPEPDPWLIPGWPYEVWDDPRDTMLSYFSHVQDNKIYFRTFLNNTETLSSYSRKHYRILNTPFDNAPDCATHIKIDEEGWFYFFEIENENFINYTRKSYWRNCPKQFKGKTLPIPDRRKL